MGLSLDITTKYTKVNVQMWENMKISKYQYFSRALLRHMSAPIYTTLHTNKAAAQRKGLTRQKIKHHQTKTILASSSPEILGGLVRKAKKKGKRKT